jgi:Response regulator receiver domain
VQRQALIVDDEATVCQMVGNALNTAGMEAVALTRSSEAPGLLDEGKFEMAFLDFHMASPDGIELAWRMRRSRWNQGRPHPGDGLAGAYSAWTSPRESNRCCVLGRSFAYWVEISWGFSWTFSPWQRATNCRNFFCP